MDRKQIAGVFEQCATLLELTGANVFRVNAYRNGARAIQQFDGDLEERIAEGTLTEVAGIGKTIAERTAELLETGSLTFLDELRTQVPEGLIAMMRIEGFGPKRIKQVHDELGVDTVEGLKAAADDGRLKSLKGFGDKLVAKILAGIEFLGQTGGRVLRPKARELAGDLAAALRDLPQVQRLEVCGSLRRQRETCKDIDLLVATDDPKPVADAFAEHFLVQRIVVRGDTKVSVVLAGDMAADLRLVTPAQFPFALHYFTGSKDHNVRMRQRAIDRGLKLNEYELAGKDGPVECADEAAIFAVLDLVWIPPELREDNGELAAAEKDALPDLIEPTDVTGVFHCHTNASDGGATLDEMAQAAIDAGYAYLGIADHSKSAGYAGGLQADRVRKQWDEIDAWNEAHDGSFRLYKGIESDILADGSLDYDDELLAGFDYVVASVHAPLNMSSAKMTARVVKALENPFTTMLGHPSGRLLLRRDPYPMDMDAVLEAAAANGVMIEINANPHRLDLDWTYCKRAKSLGITFVINPDAHGTGGFKHVPEGVMTARRGWLEAVDVFNTRPPAAIAHSLTERRKAALR